MMTARARDNTDNTAALLPPPLPRVQARREARRKEREETLKALDAGFDPFVPPPRVHQQRGASAEVEDKRPDTPDSEYASD